MSAEPTENSGKNTGFGNLKPWPPGHSGNPGGRPKGLAAYIREQTQDGKELVDFLLDVMRGKEKLFCKMGDRMKAVEMLIDRSEGRVKQVVDEPEDGNKQRVDWTKLTDDEFRILGEIRTRLLALAGKVGCDSTPEKV